MRLGAAEHLGRRLSNKLMRASRAKLAETAEHLGFGGKLATSGLPLIAFGGLALLVGCGPGDRPADLAARTEALAPIETAELQVRESAPALYTVHVVSGLPNGCAEFVRIDVERADPIIEISVWNTVPADEDVVCTMIYRTVENTVELGSDFDSGQSYTVRVNHDTELSFTAQ
jgi:hypothetical protein